jgi:hypothetical protein
MENIFDGRKKYADGYFIINEREFNQDELTQVAYAKVVPSQYGMSVCFYMKAGFRYYIPVSRDSQCAPGDVVDLTSAKILTLRKEGAEDIDRIDIQK